MNKIKFIFVGLLCIGLLFQACNKNEEAVLSNIEQGNHKFKKELMDDYCKRNFTIKDFPESKVFKKIPDSQGMGKKMENAIVPLLFDKEGILYTPMRYNTEARNKSIEIEEYLTDLKTFYEVTGFPYAKPEYLKEPMGDIYLFDAYQKFYKERPKTRSYETYVYKYIGTAEEGDILYTKEASILGYNYGHVAAIYNLGGACTADNADVFDISVIEAIKGGVKKQSMDIWWGEKKKIEILVYNGNISSEERSDIISFMEKQVGKKYKFLYAVKDDHNDWYCSKLIWAAYYDVLNVDLDSDGGTLVMPNDIRGSDHINRYLMKTEL